MRLSTFVFVVMLLIASVASAQVPLGSAISIKGTGGGGGGSSTPAQTTDIDSDGLYEYVRFPQDFDGDGTSWYTCDCGGSDGEAAAYTDAYICGTFRTSDTDFTQVDYSGTGGGASVDNVNNPAECRFHGQKIWDDASDDLNALYDLVTVGSEIEIQAGTYVLKGGDVPTSDSGAHTTTTCWDSGTGAYGGTCFTNADGRTLRNSVEFVHDGMQVYGAGVDADGDRDLVYEGTMFVTNNGPRTFWNTNTVNNGQIQLGRPSTFGNTITNLVEYEYQNGATSGDNSGDGRENVLCLDSTQVTAQMNLGELWQLTMTHPENGLLHRTMMYVSEISATVCGGTGVEVKFAGADKYSIDLMEDVPGDYQTAWGPRVIPATTSYVTEVAEDQISQGIGLSDVWFTHLDYIGAGGCNLSEIDVPGETTGECDTGVVLNISGGYNTLVDGIGVIQTSTSFGSGQAINTGTTNINARVQNSLFRYNQGGLIDVSQYMIFRDNALMDNTLIRNNKWDGGDTATGNIVAFVRFQADNWRVEDNVFVRNSAPTDDYLGETRISNALIDLSGFNGLVRNNTFRNNAMTCATVSSGARHMVIDNNYFECGSLNTTDTAGQDQHDRAASIVIRSKSNAITSDLFIMNNRFTGSGAHYMQEQALNHGDPRMHILITGDDFNTTVDTSGDLIGPIRFINNYFNQVDDYFSNAVMMRVNSEDSLGDPDASFISFDGNTFNQGNMFGILYLTSGIDTAMASIKGVDPDENDDLVGLPRCGINYNEGVAERVFTNTQLDDNLSDQPLGNAQIINLSAFTNNDQCDSYLDEGVELTQPVPSLGTEAGGLEYFISDPDTAELGWGVSWGNSAGTFNETNNLMGPYYNKLAINNACGGSQFEHAFDLSWETAYNEDVTDDQTWVEHNWDIWPARNSGDLSSLSGGFDAAVQVGDAISFGGTDTGIVTAWANPNLEWIQNSGIAEVSDTVTIDGQTATLDTIVSECADANNKWRPYLAVWDTVDNDVFWTWQTRPDGDQRDSFQVKNGGIAIGADTSPNGLAGPRLLVEGNQDSSGQAQVRYEPDASGTYASARGLDIQMDYNAASSTWSGIFSGLYISNEALGSGNSGEPTPRGIWITDMHNGTAIGSSSAAIYIDSQDSNDGSNSSQHGNIQMEGGNWNTGHFMVGTGQGQHIWFNATDDVFHVSYNDENMTRPTSESDGGQLLSGELETSARICDQRQWGVISGATGSPNPAVGDTLSFTGGAGGTATVTDFVNPFLQWAIDTGTATTNDTVAVTSGGTWSATLLTINTFQKPEGYVFYNDTSDYYCFCNGAGNDVQMHAPTTACF